MKVSLTALSLMACKARRPFVLSAMLMSLVACVPASIPGARDVKIPAPTQAEERKQAVNERPDSVLYLPLGKDVLTPESSLDDPLPNEMVGPFELRGETLAGALQLILADYEIPLAFESEEGLTRQITVSNLKGPLDLVVKRVCGLANLYCSFEDGLLVVKETQIFTVSIPPVGGDQDIMSTVATGLAAITGQTPIIDQGTRTIVYTATQRNAKQAEQYFQRLRSSTALIVFEIYIWEVSLNASNATGIDWENISQFGKFAAGISVPGSAVSNFNPISIGLPTTGDVAFGADQVIQFISNFGAVKTISQPQITVLSGGTASLRVADTVNYVSSLERSSDEGETSVSTETDTVDTGFTLNIGSAWDNSTIYGNIDIELQEFRGFTAFDTGGGSLQLPQTTERQLQTQVRIRPGDSLLIAGLVRENDDFDKTGPGFNQPILPTSRSAEINNVELVFLMRPRVIVYTNEEDRQRVEKNMDRGGVIDTTAPPRPVEVSATLPETHIEPIQFVTEEVEPNMDLPPVEIRPMVPVAPVAPVQEQALPREEPQAMLPPPDIMNPSLTERVPEKKPEPKVVAKVVPDKKPESEIEEYVLAPDMDIVPGNKPVLSALNPEMDITDQMAEEASRVEPAAGLLPMDAEMDSADGWRVDDTKMELTEDGEWMIPETGIFSSKGGLDLLNPGDDDSE